MHGPMESDVAKALSSREALSWLKTMGYNKIILETDAQQVSLAFNSSNANLSYFGAIIDDCTIFSRDLSN